MSQHEPSEYRIFVYGTLRPGGSLEWMMQAALSYPRKTRIGIARGWALYEGPDGAYPYMARRRDGSTIGTIATVRNGRAFQTIVDMECGAGYEVVAVDVSVFNEVKNADGETEYEISTERAWSFVIQGDNRRYLGRRIEGDDWIAHVEAKAMDPAEIEELRVTREISLDPKT